jgi:hypothetical protein
VLAGNTATANFALAPSTGAISGTVTDAAGDTPISGATVSDGVRTASTNASGVYSLTGVPAGTYTVTASAAGYYSAGQTVAVTAGNTTTANFTLTGQPPAPTPVVTVTNITPDTMKRGTSMAVTITGSGFAAGAGVRFENGDGPAPTASNVVVVDSLTIKATVTAKNGGPSRNSHWVVKVTNPDGSAGSLNGLTVVP